MITKYTHKKLTWVDVESPTQEEARDIMHEHGIDPLIAEELLLPTLKPKVELYSNAIYLILHFPAFKHTHNNTANQEIDFVIGKNFLITTRYDTIDPLHKFSKLFEVNSILDKVNMQQHAGFLFFFMIKKLYKAVEHELEYIQSTLTEIEGRIFEGKEKEMVFELSNMSRELLNFKQALNHHREILESFNVDAKKFLGENFGYHVRIIQDEYYRIYNEIQTHIDFLNELRETNNSLLYTKQNEVMKVLTIMAFVTFPLSLIASIFGMNTTVLPIVGNPYDFWIIMGIMGVATTFFFIFFKINRWL